MPNVAHFAINATDTAASMRFYEKVFGWKFEPWGPPGFYQIKTGSDGPMGALQGRRELVKGTKTIGFECTIGVDSIDETERAVLASGGAIVLKQSIIPTVGTLAFYSDPDGNVFGAMQYDRGAQ
jgi:predicted enzyme related to lactoylglutathione lyase